MIINAISVYSEKPKADGIVDLRLNSYCSDYAVEMLSLLPETIEECKKWLMWKRYGYDRGLLPLFEDEIKNGNLKIEFF